ncbi:hypothetical protein ABPG77_005301 [Micractinium sp. CCAP 211/92]
MCRVEQQLYGWAGPLLLLLLLGGLLLLLGGLLLLLLLLLGGLLEHVLQLHRMRRGVAVGMVLRRRRRGSCVVARPTHRPWSCRGRAGFGVSVTGGGQHSQRPQPAHLLEQLHG